MSAEEKETYRVNIVVSELDKKDGVSIKPQYRNVVLRGEVDREKQTINNTLDYQGKGTITGKLDVVSFGKKSIAQDDTVTKVEWVATAGNVLIAKGVDWDFANYPLFADYNNVNVEIKLTVNSTGADNVADDVDDRLQEVYLVKTETGIGSDLFEVRGNYTINKGDDLAKLVKEGEYNNLPGLFDYEFDKDYNEYVLQYTVEGDTIYGRWVKEGSPRFAKVEAEKEYDELDANKDGVVSCEEALGKGWVWNNETSACELKGSSNTGSYVPNTATK